MFIRVKAVGKALQRSLYTTASSPVAIFVLIVLGFITLNSLIHFLDALMHVNILNKATFYKDGDALFLEKFHDNIGRVDSREWLVYEPMDVVYTWVNGSDPRQQELLQIYRQKWNNEHPEELEEHEKEVWFNQTHFPNGTKRDWKPSISVNRYRDNDELKYSLRSLERFAPWVRKIFIVTSGQVPNWLDLSNKKIQIVTHADIFLNSSHLPVFSSPAIESHLHRIPGLSEKFIYLNDDVFFGDSVYPEDFFSISTGYNVFLSWGVPDCSPGCSAPWIGDGYCDSACNNTACDWDGGDCKGKFASSTPTSTPTFNWYGNRASLVTKQCNSRCPNNWIGDKFCDRPCNTIECGFDAGDCGLSDFPKMKHFEILQRNSSFTVHSSDLSAFFNLSKIFPSNSTISSGDHDNPNIIRTSTISQTNRVLVLTFLQGNNKTEIANLTVEGQDISGKNFEVHISVTILKGVKSNDTQEVIASHAVSDVPNNDSQPEIALNASEEPSQDNGGDIKVEVDNALSSVSSFLEAQKEKIVDIGEDEMKDTERTVDHENDHESDHRVAETTQNVEESDRPGSKKTEESRDKLSSTKNPTENSMLTDYSKTETTSSEYVKDVKRPRTKVSKKKRKRKRRKKRKTHGNRKMKNSKELGYQDSDSERLETAFQNHRIRRAYQLLHGKGSENQYNIGRRTLSIPLVDQKEITHSLKHNYIEKRKAFSKNLSLDELMKDLQEAREEEQQQRVADTNLFQSPTRRRILDKFGDSLVFVDKLLNHRFGRVARKVPAHMPHMIDKRIMDEVYSLWPKEFNDTSSHRFRSSTDMQYSFTYFYYLMHASKRYDSLEYFSQTLDRNHDGFLDDYEIRYLALSLEHSKVTKSMVEELVIQSQEEIIEVEDAQDLTSPVINTSTNSNSSIPPSPSSPFQTTPISSWNQVENTEDDFNDLVKIVRSVLYQHILISNGTQPNYAVYQASGLSSLLGQKLNNTQGKYPYQLKSLDQVGFHMIRDDDVKVNSILDELRWKHPKFICLNDDMNATHPNPKVIAALHNFYQWYFPHASQFELKNGKTNPPHLYRDELLGYYRSNRLKSAFLVIFILSLIGGFIWFQYKNKGKRAKIPVQGFQTPIRESIASGPRRKQVSILPQ